MGTTEEFPDMAQSGPWQAWVGAGISGASTMVYVALVTSEGIAEGDLSSVIGIALSLSIATACAVGGALARSRRASMALLSVALVPLLVWGLLGAWTVGGLFLLAGLFVVAAMSSLARHRPERGAG